MIAWEVRLTNRFIVADDHPLFRGALKLAVEKKFPDAEVLEATTFDDVAAHLEQNDDVDLVLLDLNMPGVRGFSGLMYLRAQYAQIPVVIVSATDSPEIIQRCIDFGSMGFMPKSLSADAIGKAVAQLLDGENYLPHGFEEGVHTQSELDELIEKMATLTPQQVRVLMMLSEGLLNKQIAYELEVSEATVKAHVSAILQKLNVESRTQAVILASKIEVDNSSPMQA